MNKTVETNKCDCKCIHKEKKELADKTLKEVNNLDAMIDFFKNFADSTRLKILIILDKVEAMCVCDIAVALNMTKSAISHQLRYLKEYNLIRSEKSGKVVFYSLADSHVKDILELCMTHVEEE